MAGKGREAMLQATAGSAGGVLAVVLLAPLGTIKTRMQATVKKALPTKLGDDGSAEENGGSSREVTQDVDSKVPDGGRDSSSMLGTAKSIVAEDGLAGLFVGLMARCVQTAVQNFVFFYWLSFLRSTMQRLVSGGRRASSRDALPPLSFGLTMLVSSMAGALNMTTTLPLEVAAIRAQTAKLRGKRSTTLLQELQAVVQEDGVLGLWNGLAASLILTANPAVQMATFDKLETAWLKLRGRASLSTLDAFVVGAVSKACAIGVTYPLIRAKVILQAKSKQDDDGKDSGNASNAAGGLVDTSNILKDVWATEGFAGLYKGMSAQMGKTVLGAALTMATKQQVYDLVQSAASMLSGKT